MDLCLGLHSVQFSNMFARIWLELSTFSSASKQHGSDCKTASSNQYIV